MPYLYVFIDESGNYDFSKKGTKFWVCTSVIAADISPGVRGLYELKHEIIDLGVDLEYFHAAEDRQVVRNRVFQIFSQLTNVRVDTVVVEKRKVAPKIRPLPRFYPMMVENLLKYPFDPRGLNARQYDKVFIFLDRASARANEREALKKGVKRYLSKHLHGTPYVICMHQSASHPYLQMVDYYSWAIYVKWERNDQRPYNIISHLVKNEIDIFQHGYVKWY